MLPLSLSENIISQHHIKYPYQKRPYKQTKKYKRNNWLIMIVLKGAIVTGEAVVQSCSLFLLHLSVPAVPLFPSYS